jgi:methionyl-tRNA formyltransferase
MRLKIFIAGQRHFGAEVFSLCLKAGHDVVGVCAPVPRELRIDTKLDRLTFAASEASVPIVPAGGLNADSLPRGVDLIIAAHSHDFIGRKTRMQARLGAIGYHPSLLPRHRGRDAVRWALRFGDPVTGGSVYWLDEKVDGGPLAAQSWCWIRPRDTAEELWRRELSPMGIRLFADVLGDLSNGRLVRVPQDEALATWEPALTPPPLRRPDLPMLGAGDWAGFTVEAEPVALLRR